MLSFPLFGRDVFPIVQRKVRGIRGEVHVAETLRELETDGYRVLHDIDIGRGNVDHVVVGPTGVVVIETKAWTGRVCLDADGKLMCGGRPEQAAVNQAVGEAMEIKRRLRNAGLDVWVEAVIALTHARLRRGPARFRHVTVVEAGDLPGLVRARRPSLSEKEIARARAAILRGDQPVTVRAISF